MDEQVPCAVCGNELAPANLRCPFCGAGRQAEPPRPRRDARTVNLEKGLPTVAQALARLHQEILQARAEGYRALVLIHGYGSSGEGGAIRSEVRRQLSLLREQKKISDYLPGEECGRHCGHARQLARQLPFLAGQLRTPNPGITIVVF
jgi:hypothetical protein